MAPFYGCGPTASGLEALQGGSLLFTTRITTKIKLKIHACFTFYFMF